MKVTIGQLEFGSYTLTVVSDSDAGARKALRAAYNKATPKGNGNRTFAQHAEYAGLNIWETELDKVEWL